jgi:glycerol uptake facilitator-like aquaporin
MPPVGAKWSRYVQLAAIALGIRLAYLAAARPPFESQYWLLSDGLLTDGSLAVDGVRTTTFEPLYPLFLALARVITQNHVIIVQAIQAAVAAAGAAIICRLGETMTGRARIGVMAGLLYACYPLLIRHSVDGSETALLTTLLLAFAASGTGYSEGDIPSPVPAGVWLGLAALTRSTVLPLVGIAPLVAARKARLGALTMFAVAIAIYSPYAIRNQRLSGGATPARIGQNLFISTWDRASALFPTYSPDAVGRAAGAVLERQVGNLPETPENERLQDETYVKLAIAEVKRHPWQTLWQRVTNVAYFFWPRLVPYRLDDGTPRPVWHQLAYSLSYGVVLVCAAIGIGARRHELERDAMLWAIVGSFTIVHAVFFPTTRYRVPIEFVLLLYAAVGIDRLSGSAVRR